MIDRILLAFALAAPIAELAAQTPSRPAPDDPRAPAALDLPASAFTEYRRYSEEPLASWPKLNEEVANQDSHAGHSATMPRSANPDYKPKAEAAPLPTGPGAHDAHQNH
jgi:hypothetical protein